MENVILKSLISNEHYAKQIIPFLNESYFSNKYDKAIVSIILHHYNEYKTVPTYDEILFDSTEKYVEETQKEIFERIDEVKKDTTEFTFEKLVNETEKFFKNISLRNGIIQCAEMIEKNETKSFDAIPDILKKALSVSFKSGIGIDFKCGEDIKARFNAYINRPEKIFLSTKLMNYITDGGFERKTLNMYIAPTHVGKTWKLIDDASFFFKEGYNVLYVTLEMSKEKITQRIETNLFKIPTNQFKYFTFEDYVKNLKNIKANDNKKLGNLIVEEYPSSTINTNHISLLIDKLELKKSFVPDILIVDYLGIMKPKDGNITGMYEKAKNIAEELRGLATEKNICVLTAIQTNRSGFSASDFDLQAASESIGVPFTADAIFAIIRDDQLDDVNEVWIKVLKNRYAPINNKKFNLGSNVYTQSFHDVDQGANSDFSADKMMQQEVQHTTKDFSGFKFDE